MHDNAAAFFLFQLLFRITRLLAIAARDAIINGAPTTSSPVREYIAICVLYHNVGISINYGGPDDLPISMSFRGVTVTI